MATKKSDSTAMFPESIEQVQKSMPKVKAAVIPEVEEVSPVNMTMAVSVTAAVVVVLSGMAFLLFKLNHRYIPAYCRRGAGSLKNLFFKTKKHLKK